MAADPTTGTHAPAEPLEHPGPREPHLAARGLHRSFVLGRKRIEVLRGVDLAVANGEAVFICGKSGAGKTTLLYTLAGLERPDRGEVLLAGRPLYGQGETELAAIRNRALGFVFQNYFLLPELTALENVALPARIAGRPDGGRAAALLAQVGLAERAAHLPSELSGGEQQRVAIARALVNDPGVVFADEPTGNLDSATGGEVMDLLLALVRRERRTLIVVTHDPNLAARGDRRLVMLDGLLVP